MAEQKSGIGSAVGGAARGVGAAAREVSMWGAAGFFRHGPVGFLIPIVLIGFIAVSSLAAGKGINDLLTVARPDLGNGFVVWLYIGMVVVLATSAMWLSLELALHRGSAVKRTIAIIFYVFLTLWSLGFGYGFWWSMLAGRQATQDRMVALQDSLATPVALLSGSATTLANTVDAVANQSEARQVQETDRGRSCDNAPNSGVGRGPLAIERDNITLEIRRVTQRIRTEWVTPLQNGATELNQIRERVARMDAGSERLTKESFDAVGREAAAIGLALNTLYPTTAPALKQELDGLAARMDPGSVCVDSALSQRLREASASLTPPPETTINVPDYVHEAYATAYAFDRLWRWAFSLVGLNDNAAPTPSAALGAVGATPAQPTPDQREGPTRNDLVALVAAIVVELGIFVFTVASPRRPFEQADLARRARTPVQERLKMAFKTFQDDDNVDARRTFDELLLHVDRGTAYLMQPTFRTLIQAEGENIELAHKRRFIQNVVIVLEEARAIDRTVKYGPVQHFMATYFPNLSSSQMFNEAFDRLAALGWTIRNAADFVLHRIRRSELLEVLMMLREEVRPVVVVQQAAPAKRKRRSAQVEADDLEDDDDTYEDEAPAPSHGLGLAALFQRVMPRAKPKEKKARRGQRRQAYDEIETEAHAARATNGAAPQPAPAAPANSDPYSDVPTPMLIDELDNLTYQTEQLSRAVGDAQYDAARADLAVLQNRTMQLLQSRGLQTTPTSGRFDPSMHRVIAEQPSSQPPGAIVKVIRHGLRDAAGSLVREAHVIVSAGLDAPISSEPPGQQNVHDSEPSSQMPPPRETGGDQHAAPPA